MSADELTNPDRTEAASNTTRRRVLLALLTIGVLVLLSSLYYLAGVYDTDARHTEFYLLNENESGELVAQNYSVSVPAEEPFSLYLGIENHEGKRIRYHVVVRLQRIYFENDTPVVLDSERLRTVSTTVSADGRWLEQVNVTPTMEGSGMRMVFLLYRTAPPETPTRRNAYLDTHIWLNVTVPQNGENASAFEPLPHERVASSDCSTRYVASESIASPGKLLPPPIALRRIPASRHGSPGYRKHI